MEVFHSFCLSLLRFGFAVGALLFFLPLSWAKPFKPKTFNSHEFATLGVLAEAILPSGDFPGAREAEVNKFIDFQAVYDRELKRRFRNGLSWLDRRAQSRYGRKFRHLNPQQRREILDRLRYKALQQPGDEVGQDFYRLARRYTEMGFYSSRAGLKVLRAPVEQDAISERSRQ
jgi:hypothetical protein